MFGFNKNGHRMKKCFFLALFLILIYSALHAQQKVERFYDANWKECAPSAARYYSVRINQDSMWHQQDFYIPEKVLQMDGYYKEGIKHGMFTYFHLNGRIQSYGKFKNDKREGVHVRFYESGMMADSTHFRGGSIVGNNFSWFENGTPSAKMAFDTVGNQAGFTVRYFMNKNISEEGEFGKGMKKHGRWTYYHDNGKKSSIVDYDYDLTISKRCFDEEGIEQTLCDVLRHNAEFPGGHEKLEKYVLNHIEWPRIKLRVNGALKIQVAFTIDRDGNVKDAKLERSIHPAIDHAVLVAFQNMPKWKPAMEFNRKVSVGFLFPITKI
jgi:hypothetical protein